MLLNICKFNTNQNFNIIDTELAQNQTRMHEYIKLTLEELQANNYWKHIINKNNQYSLISICNYPRKKDLSVIFIYITIKNMPNGYQITATNWLDFLHLSESVFNDTNTLINKIRKLNTTFDNDEYGVWKKVSKAGLLKAFSPIIYFIPRPLRSRINSYSLYNVSSAISATDENYSKDYIRNFFNKVITNLKTDFAILNYNHAKSSLVDNIVHNNDEIGGCLLHSELNKPINIIHMDSNIFLESIFTMSEQKLPNRV